MNKTLNYVPIYRGEFNMTPERRAQINLAKEYVYKNDAKRNGILNEVIKCLIMFGCMLAVGYVAII